jgi:hypothetical protein
MLFGIQVVMKMILMILRHCTKRMMIAIIMDRFTNVCSKYNTLDVSQKSLMLLVFLITTSWLMTVFEMPMVQAW